MSEFDQAWAEIKSGVLRAVDAAKTNAKPAWQQAKPQVANGAAQAAAVVEQVRQQAESKAAQLAGEIEQTPGKQFATGALQMGSMVAAFAGKGANWIGQKTRE